MKLNIFRLSYHQRIKEMMPDAYSRLIPPEPKPDYKYMHEGAGKYQILIKFCSFVHDKDVKN